MNNGELWPVGGIYYKMLQVIPWRFSCDPEPTQEELTLIRAAIMKLVAPYADRVSVIREFILRLKADPFNNTEYRQEVVKRLFLKQVV